MLELPLDALGAQARPLWRRSFLHRRLLGRERSPRTRLRRRHRLRDARRASAWRCAWHSRAGSHHRHRGRPSTCRPLRQRRSSGVNHRHPTARTARRPHRRPHRRPGWTSHHGRMRSHGHRRAMRGGEPGKQMSDGRARALRRVHAANQSRIGERRRGARCRWRSRTKSHLRVSRCRLCLTPKPTFRSRLGGTAPPLGGKNGAAPLLRGWLRITPRSCEPASCEPRTPPGSRNR